MRREGFGSGNPFSRYIKTAPLAGFTPFKILGTILLAVVLAALPCPAAARPTTAAEARTAATRWLARDPRPLGAPMARVIAAIHAHADAAGQPEFYVVDLAPDGFAIISGDDQVEPVVAFSAVGRYEATRPNPLRSLVTRDLPGRVAHTRARQKSAAAKGQPQSLEPAELKAREKWTRLAAPAAALATPSGKTASLSDMRVAPLVASRWDQETVFGQACYNYYTPPGAAGNALNYPAGCVATAMAQIMRYHLYPVSAVGPLAYEITVDNDTQSHKLLGGNGAGGVYPWGTMPLRPDRTVTTAQRAAIGAVTHDAGLAVNMMYAQDGSGAYVSDAADQLVKTFQYANAVWGFNRGAAISPSALHGMIDPGLDAGYPSLLGITGAQAFGHAVVCDGYGFNDATLYHHLNMGWSGYDDTWYNLPLIDTSVVTFDTVDECVYNVFPAGTGEIISGRVIDSAGRPLAGAEVLARRSGSTATFSDTTDSAGIYALAHVASSATYTLEATLPGYKFNARTATTGTSIGNRASSGNLWGIDIKGQASTAAHDWRGYE